ncbi:MAG: hypothetical protein CSA53_05030 [Gammaproteobacteria bacterium]|nr:MAG: hypothetical protein CSA53_05030 [Gammaproteobacteria bacterium]
MAVNYGFFELGMNFASTTFYTLLVTLISGRFMNDQNSYNSSDSDAQQPAHKVGVNSSRRRLLGAGLAAAPVLLTLQSRNAWGNALCSPSAFSSVTYASHSPTGLDCSAAAGGSPQYWLSRTDEWEALGYLPDSVATGLTPSSPDEDKAAACGADNFYDSGDAVYCRTGATFVDIFGFGPVDMTLAEVIINQPDSMEAHAVAAALNAAAGYITLGFDNSASAESTVRTIFSALQNNGGYTLSTGQTMYWSQDPDGIGYTFRQYFTHYEFID